MNRDAFDTGRKPGLTTRHKEFVELRRGLRVLEEQVKWQPIRSSHPSVARFIPLAQPEQTRFNLSLT
ncbi:MAG: hypothetical protein NT132_04155 [Microbacterium sp.]|nr:hypothetical protein [Microbacterium sp.]MCX6501593.1 hypothetical protein [Microbacterium sp.]